MKKAVFWDATPCGSCKNSRFGGTYRLHHQGGKNVREKCSVFQLLVTANVLHSSLLLFTVMMNAISSSETPVLIRATWSHIPE
jgi:hypothetical protein